MALSVAGGKDGLFMNRSIVRAAGGSFRPGAARGLLFMALLSAGAADGLLMDWPIVRAARPRYS